MTEDDLKDEESVDSSDEEDVKEGTYRDVFDVDGKVSKVGCSSTALWFTFTF